MSFPIGFVVIIISTLIPNPFHASAFFWPIILATILSFLCGVTRKFTILKFSMGVLLGSVTWIMVNLFSWAQLAVFMTLIQILPTFSAIIGFAVGDIFSPVPNENA